VPVVCALAMVVPLSNSEFNDVDVSQIIYFIAASSVDTPTFHSSGRLDNLPLLSWPHVIFTSLG